MSTDRSPRESLDSYIEALQVLSENSDPSYEGDDLTAEQRERMRRTRTGLIDLFEKAVREPSAAETDAQHFTNQAFRHIEQAGDLTPEQHLQAAQAKAMLALAAATMAAARR